MSDDPTTPEAWAEAMAPHFEAAADVAPGFVPRIVTRNTTIYHGDLFEILPTLPAESIDACVTDGPYGIGFMGREWDTFKPDNIAKEFDLRQRKEHKQGAPENIKGRTRSPAASPSQIEYDRTLEGQRAFQTWCEQWAREVYRVLKPGAYIVSCGAPRSHHRMMCGLEDAGFVTRDCLAWLFGSGFPKNKNLGNGRGTALKPANEPIALAWKPFKGTITANFAQHGTGALNIDACRLEGTPRETGNREGESSADQSYAERGSTSFAMKPGPRGGSDLGRWPPNVVMDEDGAAALDAQTGELRSGFMAAGTEREGIGYGGDLGTTVTHDTRADSGGASRFYYVAKPSRADRDFGCFSLAPKTAGEATDRKDGSAGLNNPRAGAGRTGGARNFHPTVKPVDLMRWLVRLITPPGGVVLDPFTGSGTTGIACRYEDRPFIGCEREAEYIEIAERRIAAVDAVQVGLFEENAEGLIASPASQLDIAERIAREAHAEQKDTVTGAPYITHIERVVAMVEGNDAKAVAWLHDVLEDTQVTGGDICRAGISDDVRLAVERLTRGGELESYAEYIETIRVCGPELARVVKIADLRDHLQPNCPTRLRHRYEAALAKLAPKLAEVSSPARPQLKNGATMIASERARQMAVEGWSEFHDDTHKNGEMARAAACYALQHTRVSGRAIRWPWSRDWWKPKSPIRNLVRAGALIAAEIDRLQRASKLAEGAASSATPAGSENETKKKNRA